MLLLAIDTSGKDGSIALTECGPNDACRVIEVVPLVGGTFSAQLVPQISSLLEKHGFDKHAIGAFAAASGPGSFTGLRVGLAAIKALAEVLQKPIAAVSLLEAVAESAHGQGSILAALDAGRGEVYLGKFEIAPAGTRLIVEQLLSREECLQSAAESTIVTPDQNLADAARAAGLKVQKIDRPRSDAIARIGWLRIQAGQLVSPEELEANYIRRSDAEIFARTDP